MLAPEQTSRPFHNSAGFTVLTASKQTHAKTVDVVLHCLSSHEDGQAVANCTKSQGPFYQSSGAQRSISH